MNSAVELFPSWVSLVSAVGGPDCGDRCDEETALSASVSWVTVVESPVELAKDEE